MSAGAAVLVLLAGVWAGVINTVVGSGTLVTFPMLLAVGLPPVVANVSNTVGLVPGSVAGSFGYRRELAGQLPRVRLLSAASAAGGLAGAVLVFVLPASAFRAAVPVLIALAVVLVLLGPRINRWMAGRGRGASDSVRWPVWLLTAATGVYGGYFGAAQGVLLVALLAIFLTGSLQSHNALKNVLAGLVNLVAAVLFAFTADVDWTAAALIAGGSVVGGLLGARIGRALPPTVLRVVIALIGCVAIVALLV